MMKQLFPFRLGLLILCLFGYGYSSGQELESVFQLSSTVEQLQTNINWVDNDRALEFDPDDITAYIESISNYEIQVGTTPESFNTVEVINDPTVTALNISSYVAVNEQYYVRVLVNFEGNQVVTNTEGIYILSTPGDLTLAASSGDNYRLSWPPVPQDAPNFAYYRLDVENTVSGLNSIFLTDASLAEFEVILPADGTASNFTLSTVDTLEQTHQSISTSFQAEDLLAPPLPIISVFEREGRSLSVAWDVTALNLFGDFKQVSIYAAKGFDPCTDPDTYSDCIAGLAIDTTILTLTDPFIEELSFDVPYGSYTFFIETEDQSGNIQRSDIGYYFDVIDDIPPPYTYIDRVEPGDMAVDVFWVSEIDPLLGYSDVAVYELFLFSSDGFFANFVTVPGNERSYRIEEPNLVPGVEFRLSINAVDSAGNYSETDEVTFTMSDLEREGNNFFSEATLLRDPVLSFFYGPPARLYAPSLMNGLLESGETDIYSFNVEEGKEYELILRPFDFGSNPLNDGQLEIFSLDTANAVITQELSNRLIQVKYVADYTGTAYARVSGENSPAAAGQYQLKLYHNFELLGREHGGESRATAPDILEIAAEIEFVSFSDPFGSFDGRLASSIYPAAAKKYYRIEISEPDIQLDWIVESRTDIKVALEDENGNRIRTWDSHESILELTGGERSYAEFVKHTFNDPGTYYLLVAASDRNPTATATFMMEAPLFKRPYEINAVINEVSYGRQGNDNAYAPIPFVEIWVPNRPLDKLFYLDLTVGDTTFYSDYIDPSSYSIDPFTGDFYYLVTSDIAAFEALYGDNPAIPVPSLEMPDLEFLSPEGGVIYLATEDEEPLDELIFGEITGQEWPTAFAGNRGTLELQDPDSTTLEIEEGLNHKPESWKISLQANGTPFQSNSRPSIYIPDRYESNQRFGEAKFLLHSEEDSLTLSSALSSNFADTVDWYQIQAMPGDEVDISMDAEGINFNASMNIFLEDSILVEAEPFVGSDDGLVSDFFLYLSLPFGSGAYYSLDIPTEGNDPNTPFNIWLRAYSQSEGEGTYKLSVQRKYTPRMIGWKEDFENSFESFLPPHWTIFSTDNNANEWQATGDLEEDEGVAAGIFFNPQQSDDWLVSPILRLSERAEFIFETKAVEIQEVDRDFSETFEVWVGNANAGENPSDYFERLLVYTTSSTEFETVTVDLSKYTGQDIRVAIRNVSENANLQLIDNVELLASPAYGSLFGAITRASDDLPLAGVNIQVGNQEVTTEANGEYRFTDLLTGTQEVLVNSQDYKNARFNVLIEKDVEDTLNVSLLDQPEMEQVYFSGLEQGEDLGNTSSWQRSTSILYEGEEIVPTRNYMLLFGGEQGYETGSYTSTWLSQAIDLVNYGEAKLKFRINQKSEAGDGLKLYLVGEQLLPAFFDTQGDSLVSQAFVRSGSTDGWEEVEVDISAVATGELLGNAVRIGFAFESTGETSDGFGVAIDDIEILAAPANSLPVVRDLTVNCPTESDRATLSWTAVEGVAYQVLRSNIHQRQFELIGTVEGGSFVDATVGIGQLYTYRVQAINSSETGYTSNEVVAHPRVITDFILTEEQRYTEDFESSRLGFLPADWSIETSIRDSYRFTVGDSARATDDFVVYPEKGQFAYIAPLVDNSLKRVGTQSILATPWLEASQVESNLLLRFEAIVNDQSKKYYVGIKTDCQADWVWIDSLETLPTWTDLEYKLNDFLSESNRFRVGFMVEHQVRTDQADQNQFGIDNVTIGEFDYATLTGTVTNPLGAPVPGAAVFVGDAEPYYTNKQGRFDIDSSAELFEESVEDIKVVSWYHSDTAAIRDVSLQANMERVDFELQPDLPRVRDLKLEYAQNGDAMLSWEEVEQPGLLIQHDGNSEETLAEEGQWFAFKLSSSQLSMSYWLEGVEMRLAPRSTEASAEVKLLGQTTAAKPDWGMVYAERSIEVGYDGNFFVEVDTVVPPEVFIAIKLSEASIPLDYSVPGRAFTSQEIGANWVNRETNGGAMFEIHAATGVDFSYDYDVYKGAQPGELSLIATVSRPFFTDTLVAVGQTYYYRVAGRYSIGLSPRSLPVIYDIDTLAWLEVDKEPILVEIPANQMDSTYQLQISNEGQDPLTYEVMFESDIPQGRIAGSRMYSYNSLEAGNTKEIHIALTHGGNDMEGIRYASIRFPEGVSVVQSTVFRVAENGAFLVSNGATGQEVQWFSPTGIDGVSPIKAGMTAYTKLTVEVASSFGGVAYFDYTLIGDERGEGESEVSGRYDMQGLPISVNGNTGTVAPGVSSLVPINIVINESKPGRYQGRVLIESNDANTAVQTVPFNIEIGKEKAAVEFTLANEQNNQPLEGATISIGGRRVLTDAVGTATVEGLSIGQYSYKVYHPDYLFASDTLTLEMPNEVLRRTVLVQADLPSPFAVQVADSSNRMEVSWDFEASPSPVLGFEGQAGEFADAPWMTEKGLFQYSDREVKDGATSLAIRSTQVGDTAILIGPKFTPNAQAGVSFWAKVGGENNQNNEGRLLIMSQLPTGEQTVVSEIEISNAEWSEYTVDLSAVDNAEAHLVLGAITIQGSVLYIDDMKLNEQTRLTDAKRAAVNLQLYKSVNGVESLLLDNIGLGETNYTDMQVKPDSSYAYRLKAVYNLGSSPFSEQASSLLANVAPTIEPVADVSMQEDEVVTRELVGADKNGTELTFTAISDTAGVTVVVEANTLTVAPIPDWHGTAEVSAIVSDGSLLDTTRFTVAVTAVNDAPRFTTNPDDEVNQGTEYVYQFAFEDPEGDAVSFTIEQLPSWLALVDGEQTLRGTPSTSDIGEHTLSISATDGQNTSRQEVVIEVLDFNYPAAFTSEPSLEATESVNYSYTIQVEDRDGDDLTVTAPLLPGWLSFDDASLILSGVPQHQDVGVAEVTLSVTDGQNITEQSFSITVLDTNQAPVFTSNPIVEVEEKDTYLYNVTASDPDGDPVTLSAASLPDWLSFSGATGLLTGVPNTKDIGVSSVILRATDPSGYVQEQSFTIEVTNRNDPPEFTSVPIVEAVIEQAYIYAVTAFDQDGDTITIASEEMPSWLNLETAGIDYAILSGIPFEENIGDSLVSLTATDGKSEPAKQLFFVKVGYPTGLGDAQLESQITLYPNPAVEEVTLSLPPNIGKELHVWLFNTAGKLVQEWPSLRSKAGELKLPLQQQAGQYLLMLKAGDKWAVKPLIIQHK